MVKHRQFDATVTSSRLRLAESDVKHEFHCFRCNNLKQHRIRAFWETPEGEKTICKGCYEDLMKKRGKQQKEDDKKRKREEAAQKEAKRQKENDYVLCPLLLEALEKANNHISLEEYLQLAIRYLNEENSGHYYSLFVPLLTEHGWVTSNDSNENSFSGADVPLENGKVIVSGENLEKLSRLVTTIHKKESCFKEHQRKIIQKIKAKVDFAVEKEQNLDVWLTLTSASDLRKIRACLEDAKYLERVSKTILDFVLPEIQQLKGKKSAKEELQTIKIELWNTVSLIRNILKHNTNGVTEAGVEQGKKVLAEVVASMTGFFSDKQLKSLQQDKAQNQ